MIDIHSHVLPGVDDGSRNLEESLEILRGLEEQGITELICTPHFIAETKQCNPCNKNEKILDELKQAADDANIKIKLHLGNEIYIDKEIPKYLRTKKMSPLGNKYLLVELPMSGKYPQYRDILIDLQEKGWKVILAHPERYHSFQNKYELIDEITKLGILLQCNIGSINKQYGKEAKKTIVKLAKDHKIFCFGTDIHHPAQLACYKNATKKLRKYYTERELNTLLVENPNKIVK